MTAIATTIGFIELTRSALQLAPVFPRNALATARTLLLHKNKAYSIGALLEKQAEQRPNHTALCYQDAIYSYAEFNQRANQVAHYLASRGVTAGDVVAIFMENRPEALFAVAGIVKLGAIASMINTSQRGDVLIHSLTLVTPKLIIVGAELLAAMEEVSEALGEEFLSNRLFQREHKQQHKPNGYIDLDAKLRSQAITNPPTTGDVLLGQPAFYIFTSGTTGLPKASVMSHLRWMRVGYSMGLVSMGMRDTDVVYCCLPLYHNNALTLVWSTALAAGGTIALARKFSASRFWDDIRRYRATIFSYIGELCRYLLSQPPRDNDRQHAIRCCVGNGLRAEIWEQFKQRFAIDHINEFYGASEGNLAFSNVFNLNHTAGFCPMSYAIVKYDIEADGPTHCSNGQLVKVGRGETGLLLTEVTERFEFEGYTDADASQHKLLRNVFKKGDCWFNTGDLVRDQGFKHIQFVDRLGDTYHWKGENVATTEVEAVINRWPQVEQCVVYGVEVPHAEGRTGMAAITPNCSFDEFDLGGFSRHARAQLPGYAVPSFIRLRKALDITGTFKHRKVELKKQGFDPQACKEPVIALFSKDAYEPISIEYYQQIRDGSLRL